MTKSYAKFQFVAPTERDISVYALAHPAAIIFILYSLVNLTFCNGGEGTTQSCEARCPFPCAPTLSGNASVTFINRTKINTFIIEIYLNLYLLTILILFYRLYKKRLPKGEGV